MEGTAMIAFAFALLLAGQANPAPADTAVEAETPAAAPAAQQEDEEEICRRITIVSPRTAGGHKTSKVCKTRDEWKSYVARRS